MNRRSFFRTLATAAAGFTILPAATTYDRIWKAVAVVKPVRYVPNPEWFNAPYEWRFILANPTVATYQEFHKQLAYPEAPLLPNQIRVNVPVRMNWNKEIVPPYIEG